MFLVYKSTLPKALVLQLHEHPTVSLHDVSVYEDSPSQTSQGGTRFCLLTTSTEDPEVHFFHHPSNHYSSFKLHNARPTCSGKCNVQLFPIIVPFCWFLFVWSFVTSCQLLSHIKFSVKLSELVLFSFLLFFFSFLLSPLNTTLTHVLLYTYY